MSQQTEETPDVSATERTLLLPPEERVEYSKARQRVIVAVTLTTSFLATLDLTIIATCIPTISSELNAFDREAWIGTAYLWSNVTFTPLYGRLSDIMGQRAAYEQGLALFTIGTLLCGMAPNFTTLTVARFIAGMGGGGMGTVAQVITAHAFPPSERGFYQSLGLAVFGAGIGLGGPIGGWLTQHFGWRAAFYAQIPFALVCFVLIGLAVPPSPTLKVSALKEVDFGGSLTLLLSIGALLLLLQRSSADIPFTQDAVAIAAASATVLFFLAFIYVELFVAQKPVLPLTFLTRRVQVCCGSMAALIAIVNFNMLYHLPMVFEIVQGQDLALAGSHLLPNAAAMTVAAPLVGYISKRTRRYKKLLTLCTLGPVIAMALISTITADSSWAIQWLSVIPMGAGFSGILAMTIIANLNSIKKSEIAVALGFVFVWRCIGQVLGVGLSGAVFQSSLGSQLASRFTDPELLAKLRRSSKVIKDLAPADQLLAREAYAIALRITFLFGLVGAIGVLVISLFVPDEPIVDDEEKE